MDCVGSAGFVCKVFEASVPVASPPVVECSPWGLRGGADLADRLPLPTFSNAPASQLSNVSWLLHVRTSVLLQERAFRIGCCMNGI